MVEEMKCACIRVQDCTNEWMGCIFLVKEKDKKNAIEILKNAWDDLLEDEKGQCYGDFLEARLKEANIEFDAYYAVTEGEDDSEW